MSVNSEKKLQILGWNKNKTIHMEIFFGPCFHCAHTLKKLELMVPNLRFTMKKIILNPAAAVKIPNTIWVTLLLFSCIFLADLVART